MLLHTISLSDFKNSYLPLPSANPMFKTRQIETACRDEVMWEWLRSAVEEFASDIDLVLTGSHEAVYDGQMDGVWRHDSRSWWLKRLKLRPLLTIEKLERFLGEYRLQEIPPHWVVKVSHLGANFQIIPSPVASGQATNLTTATFFPVGIRGDYTPAEFRAKYTAGFTYPLKGTITTTANSNQLVVVPDDPTIGAETAVNGFAFSKLEVKNPPWLSFNGEVHKVDSIVGSTVRLVKPVAATYTGEALILAYPEPIRRAVMSLAAIYIIEQMASRNMGVGSSSLSLDALSQSKSLNIGKGFGIYSPLIERNLESLKRNYQISYDTWAPVHMTGV
jgi:hypothetical protein